MNPRPIGVFDSGVGGLTVFKALESALPHESFVYLGDTARVPYGTRSRDTVVRYSREAARFLGRHKIKLLIVACNTASSVAIEPMVKETGVPVIGVIEPGAQQAIARTRNGRIGVVGTRATIKSEAYPRALLERQPDAKVTSRPCPLFVPLAEEGWTDGDVTRRIAEIYLAPMKDDGVDTLVLGCTHYPLLKPVIAEVMGDGVHLVDSAESVAREVHDRLVDDLAPAAAAGDARPDNHFFVTDAPEPFLAVAERFLGGPVRRLETATLD